MKKAKGVGILRLVVAPNPWRCHRCGAEIKVGQQCGKQGKDKICLACLRSSK